MKILHWEEANSQKFDVENVVKAVTGRVIIGKDDGADNFCMRMFEIGEGGNTPRHSHDWEHEIFVYSGHGEVLSGKEWVPLTTGHCVFIPANEEHQIRNAGIDPLRFVCLVPSKAPEL